MKGAQSGAWPHNLAGFSSNFSTTLITCSLIFCPVVVGERLAISKNSSTTSRPTVTALMSMTSRAVSLMSVTSRAVSRMSVTSRAVSRMSVTSRAVSLMSVTSRAVSLMSVLSSKARLEAAHDFILSFIVFLISSERSFVLRETVKRKRLGSTKCFFSGHAYCIFMQFTCILHAYSVNIAKQLLINSPSSKSFPFNAIDSHNLKLSLPPSSESFFVTGKNTLLLFKGFFLMFNFVHSCLTKNFTNLEECLVV